MMWGECISGALYINDFIALARAVGFEYPVLLQKAPIAITDAKMRALLGNIEFFSITYRLFKLPGLLEPQCEDYGQIAIYKVLFPFARLCCYAEKSCPSTLLKR